MEKALFASGGARGRSLLRAATALAAAVLQGACAASNSASTSGSSSGSTGGIPTYFDAGGCSNNGCTSDADCCSGFACHDQACCELPTSSVPCQLDTDCCAIPTDAGGSDLLPYCNANQQCAAAPNCAQLESPCNVLPCCTQPNGPVICNPLNGTCSYATGTTSSTGGSTSGGSTGASGGTSGGFGTSSGTGGGATSGGSAFNWAFTWTFGINQACEQAGVSWVEVQLVGSTIGLFPCRDQNGTEGVTLPATPLTQNSYTLTGYNAAGNLALAQATGITPFAQGTTAVPVDLTFNPGGPSNLDISWTFGGQACANAGVTEVQVTLTDPVNSALDVNESVLCASGGHQGITLQGYGAGQYPLTLSATGSDGGYQATASVSANGLSDSVAQVDLLPSSGQTSGDALVNFDFGGEGCVAAGLDSVGLQLSTIRGTPLAPAVVLACDAGASYAFSGVPAPATAFLWVEGISQGQVQQLGNPEVVVSPGASATYSVVTQLGN